MKLLFSPQSTRLFPTHRIASLRSLLISIILLCSIFPVWGQNEVSGASSGPAKLSVLPFVGENTPAFAPLVAEKVVNRRFAETEMVSTESVPSNELDLPEGASLETVSEEKLVDFLAVEGAKREASYVVAGRLRKEGRLYHLSLVLVETETGRVVLRDEKTAVGLSDLDRIARSFSEGFITAEYGEEQAEKIADKRASETVAAAAGSGAAIAELERLAEEDPESAIEQLPEKVQEEVKKRAKEEAKQEVDKEEIEKLYEEEKRQAAEQRRKRNLRITAVSSYGVKIGRASCRERV